MSNPTIASRTAAGPVPPDAPRIRTFRLVPELTDVRFTTRHLAGLGRVTGSVAVVHGRLTVDAATRTLLSLEAALDMRSFDSASAARDRVLASPRFLDSAAHPLAVYRSTSAERTDAGWTVRGTLTVKDLSAPVDLLVDDLDPETADAAHATAVVDRFAHGIAFPAVLGSRWLRVDIAARGAAE